MSYEIAEFYGGAGTSSPYNKCRSRMYHELPVDKRPKIFARFQPVECKALIKPRKGAKKGTKKSVKGTKKSTKGAKKSRKGVKKITTKKNALVDLVDEGDNLEELIKVKRPQSQYVSCRRNLYSNFLKEFDRCSGLKKAGVKVHKEGTVGWLRKQAKMRGYVLKNLGTDGRPPTKAQLLAAIEYLDAE